MSNPPREYTRFLLDAIDDGMISARSVVGICLSYMSESDVREMMEINGLPTPRSMEDSSLEDE